MRASTELGQRRCRGAVPSARPIVTRAGERAPGFTASAAVLPPGSPLCSAPCASQGCAVRALGLTSHRSTAGHSCKLPPQIALPLEAKSPRTEAPSLSQGLSPSRIPGVCPGSEPEMPRGDGSFSHRVIVFTEPCAAMHLAPGYPRLVLCSSSVDKSEVSFLN